MSFNTSYINYSSTTPKAPTAGMMFYNTDRETVQVYDGNQWLDVANEVIMTADILWNAVLGIEREHEELRQEELRKKEAALALTG